MKKIVCALIVIIFVLSGCSSDGSTYKQASQAIESNEYAEALELLDSIPEYDDKDDLRGKANEGIIQQKSEEIVLGLAEDGSYYVPTSIRVLKAGYNSALNGDKYANAFQTDGIFYFTIQAQTKGGGLATSDLVILYGGERDGERMKNDDPGNEYDSLEMGIDVSSINSMLNEHWKELGVSE